MGSAAILALLALFLLLGAGAVFLWIGGRSYERAQLQAKADHESAEKLADGVNALNHIDYSPSGVSNDPFNRDKSSLRH